VFAATALEIEQRAEAPAKRVMKAGIPVAIKPPGRSNSTDPDRAWDRLGKMRCRASVLSSIRLLG
jgi:hypothetical protein